MAIHYILFYIVVPITPDLLELFSDR